MKPFITNKSKKHQHYIIISIICSIIFWQLLALWVGRSIILPTPFATLKELTLIVTAADFLKILVFTINRMLISFAITLFLAISLGILAGFYQTIYYLLLPMISTFRSIPTMAIILLAIIWLKSEIAPILVGIMICLPILYQNIVQGIHSTDNSLLEMAKVYNISTKDKLLRIYLPSLKPFLIAAVSTISGLNVKVIIAAEVLSQPYASIGAAFQMERANLNTAGVFAWAIIAIILANTFEIVSRKIIACFNN